MIFQVFYKSKSFDVIIDDEDWDKIKHLKWYPYVQKGKFKWIRANWPKNITLHKLIMNPASGLFVDHINGNPLDNRKSNLRICTNKQNLWNAKIKKENTQTGHRGIYKQKNRFRVRFKVNQKQIHIGMYDSLDEAIEAYHNAAKKYYGEYARSN